MARGLEVHAICGPGATPARISAVDECVNGSLISPRDEVLAAWKGRSGEQRLVRTLAPGKYVVEVGGAEGRGVVGVKGPVIRRCALDARRVAEHAAEPAKGFRWPYLLLAPKAPTATTLLVVPSNTGFLSEDLELLRASASCDLARQQAMADRLGVAVLVPLFPRTASVYPVARWDAAKRFYAAAQLRATFKLYPGVAHEVTPEMASDVEAAFAAAMH